MPKDTSSTPGDSRRPKRITKLKEVLPVEFYQRLKAERKAGRSHVLTTEELCELVARVTNAQSSTSLTPDNAAEATQLRNIEISKKRQELLERISTAPPPVATPIASTSKVPLDDFKRTDLEDRKKILATKLKATLTRLNAIKELGESEFFASSEPDLVRSFQRGYRDLEIVFNHLDKSVANLRPNEWTSLNWGLTTISGIKFTGLRKKFTYVLRTIVDIFDKYFLFISVEQ